LVLGHPDPSELLRQGRPNLTRNIRNYFRDQLEALGYPRDYQTSHEVRNWQKQAILYDLVVAGRHPLARELFERATDIGPHGERRLHAV
jgi:hypothetical protein